MQDLLLKFSRELEIVGGRSLLIRSWEELRGEMDALCSRRGIERVALPQRSEGDLRSLADHLLRRGLEVVWAHRASAREELAKVDLGISLGLLGIADTGTILLQDEDEASRLVSCLPFTHVVLLPKDRIVESLSQALPFLVPLAKESRNSALTLITGPSRTSDIEQQLIKGVHGPNELHVFFLEEGVLG